MLVLKMIGLQNSGSALKIFSNFHSGRGQEVGQNYIVSRIILALGKWAILNQKIMGCHKSEHALTIFLNNLHNENAQEVHGNYVNGFSEKNYSFAQTGHFESKIGMPS